MELPETLSSALNALKQTHADLLAQESLCSEVIAKNDELNLLLAQKDKLIESINASNLQAIEEISQLKQLLEKKELAASVKVNAILSSLSVDPINIVSENNTTKTKQELWAEYHALPVEARNQFYAKNRDKLRS